MIRSKSYTGMAVFPCLFLYFRSIELALKTCLVANNVSEAEITRTLRHRLSALMTRLESFTELHEIGISADDRVMLDTFSDDYSNKWFEYPDSGFHRHPTLEELQTLSHRVCNITRTYVAP